MPIIAAGLAELRHGRFSFYPAIVGVHHNEWILRRATWTEILVANAKTSEEICIPRRFVGEVSSIEAPYPHRGAGEGARVPRRRGSSASPHRDRNAARGERFQPVEPAARALSAPAGVVAIRAEPDSESRFWRVLRGSVAAGFLACLAVIFVVRDAHLGTGFGWTSAPSRLPNLNAARRL